MFRTSGGSSSESSSVHSEAMCPALVMIEAMLWQAYQKRADEAGVDVKPPGPLAICKEIYKEEGILVRLGPSLSLNSVDLMHNTCLHCSVLVLPCCVSHALLCVRCTAPCMT